MRHNTPTEYADEFKFLGNLISPDGQKYLKKISSKIRFAGTEVGKYKKNRSYTAETFS
jgi:hypothetical protein